MLKKVQKGFTLIELLVVIVILGILSVVAVIAITKTVKSSEKTAFVTTAKKVLDVVDLEASIVPSSDKFTQSGIKTNVRTIDLEGINELLEKKLGEAYQGSYVSVEINENSSYTYNICLQNGKYILAGNSNEISSADVVEVGEGTTCDDYMLLAISDGFTPYTDFDYVLGTDQSSFANIPIASDEILLYLYKNEENNSVTVPNTYTVEGVTYKTKVLSFAYDDGDVYATFAGHESLQAVYFGHNVTFAAYNLNGDEEGLVNNSVGLLFCECSSLTSTNIPSSVTDMRYAFAGCTSLVKAPTIPPSVTNMRFAFGGCTSLTSTNIPSSVTDISYAFWGCTSLTGNININASNISEAEGTFGDTSKQITANVVNGDATLTYATLSNSSLPSNVKLLPKDYLAGFSYVLGTDTETLVTSGEDTSTYYFQRIPVASNEILLYDYNGSDTNVEIFDTYTIGGITYNTVVLSGSTTSTARGLFYENTNIVSVSFASNVDFVSYWETLSLGSMKGLFYGCFSLVSVNIPATANVVDMEATFLGCASLTSVSNIPASVTNIKGTFEQCASLAVAPSIPSSVTYMDGMFSGCASLTGTVRINARGVNNARYIFTNTVNPITVVVPSGSTTYTTFNSLTISNGMPSNVTLTTE